MSAYVISIKNELFKLRRKKKTIWLFGILLGLSILSIVAVFIIQGISGINAFQSSEMANWILRQMGYFLLPLFTAMITIDLFTGEIAQRTMKNTFLQPVERFKVYLAKLSAVLVMIVLMLAGMMISTLVMSFILLGFSGSLSGITVTFIAYIGTILPLLLLGVLTSFIALYIKSSSGALTVSIILYVVLELLGTFSPKLAIYMPTNYMQWYRYPLGSNTSIQMLLFMIAYTIMFVSLSILHFDKKEM